MRKQIKGRWYEIKYQIQKTIRKIRISNRINRRNISREEVLIDQLQQKLGKSRDEVKNMISDGLMSILTMVPTSKKS